MCNMQSGFVSDEKVLKHSTWAETLIVRPDQQHWAFDSKRFAVPNSQSQYCVATLLQHTQVNLARYAVHIARRDS